MEPGDPSVPPLVVAICAVATLWYANLMIGMPIRAMLAAKAAEPDPFDAPWRSPDPWEDWI